MTLRKGDVCFVNLSGGFGHEQTGVRPGIVLTTTDTNIVIVVPVTSNAEALRFSHTLLIRATKRNGLERDSVALLFHVRAVDVRRITSVCGALTPSVRIDIDRELRRLLRL